MVFGVVAEAFFRVIAEDHCGWEKKKEEHFQLPIWFAKPQSLFSRQWNKLSTLTIFFPRWGWSVADQGQAIVLQLIAQVISHNSPGDFWIQTTNFSGLYVRVKNYLEWIKKHAASGACEKSPQQKKTSTRRKRKKKYKKKKRKKKKKKKKKKKRKSKKRRG